MSQLTAEELNKIKSIELQILLYMDKLLSENNIDYYIIGGTALGAIRHGGFIPWDDDIDIAIWKKDEKKFLDLCSHKLDSDYYLLSQKNNPYFPHCFHKICRADTCVIEKEMQVYPKTKYGINIDIFVLYPIPQGKRWKMFLKRITYIKRISSMRIGETDSSKKRFFKGLLAPYRHIIRGVCGLLINMVLYLSSADESSWYSNVFGTVPFDKSIMLKRIMGKPTPVRFEGYWVSGPEYMNEYLKKIFGDYQILPPENERKGHDYIFVNFEKDYIRCRHDGDRK